MFLPSGMCGPVEHCNVKTSPDSECLRTSERPESPCYCILPTSGPITPNLCLSFKAAIAASDFGFLTNDDLPSRHENAALCQQAGYQRCGIPLRKEPGGPILAWVKYGANVTRAEALTQNWLAEALDANPEVAVRIPRVYDAFTIPTRFFKMGHIVMQHIDAPDCEESDVELVAKAVEWLICLKAPSFAPGPAGGGPVVHTFFYDWVSRITYNTVEELEDHVNGILALKEDTRRDSFVAEARHGFYLCPCDIDPGNFKKGRDGKVVALDFRATCFLPRSFFRVRDGEAGKQLRSEHGPALDLPAIGQCRGDDTRLFLPGSPWNKHHRSA
ncbi:hypothetical protein FISHEDRAFT_77130 [Fistulina hepatica ATCC 64428]|uniref:Aminoglycoside phosphotransferase domain-containing protein n=1 Tax=Fistulina hepatica ATCC 64428 TaxID=1128425 RepID=A0A0D7A4T2_9AGAR|nr:hypothetical protein FISHEDRAFT_77130 [Fistulina hepatica ATCC 64428]